jgi:hypothetical protein
MPMPEASVDQDNLSAARKHYVRSTRKILSMYPKSVSMTVKQTAYYPLRLGISPTNLGHIHRPTVSRDSVHLLRSPVRNASITQSIRAQSKSPPSVPLCEPRGSVVQIP